MEVTTAAELDSELQDDTRFFFVVLGEGDQQAMVYAAACEQAQGNPARGAIWIRDVGFLTGRAEFDGLSGGVIALTLCPARHPVDNFTAEQLPSDELELIIDEAYEKAAKHCLV